MAFHEILKPDRWIRVAVAAALHQVKRFMGQGASFSQSIEQAARVQAPRHRTENSSEWVASRIKAHHSYLMFFRR